jgi:hypothetical protein
VQAQIGNETAGLAHVQHEFRSVIILIKTVNLGGEGVRPDCGATF